MINLGELNIYIVKFRLAAYKENIQHHTGNYDLIYA